MRTRYINREMEKKGLNGDYGTLIMIIKVRKLSTGFPQERAYLRAELERAMHQCSLRKPNSLLGFVKMKINFHLRLDNFINDTIIRVSFIEARAGSCGFYLLALFLT